MHIPGATFIFVAEDCSSAIPGAKFVFVTGDCSSVGGRRKIPK